MQDQALYVADLVPRRVQRGVVVGSLVASMLLLAAVPSFADPISGSSNDGASCGPTLPGTGSGPTLPGTGSGPTLPGWGSGHTLPGWGSGPTLPGTGSGPTMPCTGSGPTLPGTGSGPTLPGSGSGPTLPGDDDPGTDDPGTDDPGTTEPEPAVQQVVDQPVAQPSDVVNVARPQVSGSPRVGSALSATTGSWTPEPTSWSYQWLADGSVIGGATSASFTPTASELGRRLSVTVTVSKDGVKTYSASSEATAPVEASAADAVTNTARPVIDGFVRVGSPLTASSGTWSVGDLTFAYQWLSGGSPVAGATTASYTPQPSDLGQVLSVQVTATKAGSQPVSAASTGTAAVARGVLQISQAPSVSGTIKATKTLRLVLGSVAPEATTVSIAWLRDGTAISQATGATYAVRKGDKGATLSVRVTYARPGYTDLVRVVKIGRVPTK